MTTNKDAYGSHVQAIKDLSQLYAKATTEDEERKINKLLIAAQNELTEMVARDLKDSSAKYAMLTDKLKAITTEATWLKDRVDKFSQGAEQAARVVGWLTRMVAFI